MTGYLLAAALALAGVAAGASAVLQQAVVAQLRMGLGSTAWAVFVSYVGGTLAMALVVLAMREPLVLSGAGRVPWFAWAGGVFGVVYIVIAILLLPRLGAATVLALIVAGQMLAGIVFDHFGLFGLPQHSIDIWRVLGAMMLVGGVLLIRM
jgi:transporter family-2 protein